MALARPDVVRIFSVADTPEAITKASPASAPPMDPLAVATATLERNLGWVRAADSKIPPVFAVKAAMLGVLGVRLPHLDTLSSEILVAWTIAAGALMLGMLCLVLVAFPRLAGPTNSVFYFGTASKMSEADFIERLTGAPKTDIVFDLARQAYINADIARKKYDNLRLAMIALFVAMPFWLVALISTRNL